MTSLRFDPVPEPVTTRIEARWPALDDPAAAYHAGNRPRLVAVRNTYDPDRFLDFPQAI